ncbi:MAG TPA: sigma-54 dependent transcriptional regulator [Bacteroidales bacterium]|nr:sigma-54 dependent transcriptional regulator [Bacteroidales bacterium]HRZ48950.1 sigma-54 dependent transcriptional regulator [Bacteroidales bacterium]
MVPKVLVIDDDPVILILLETILRKAGYSPFVASNGNDGLKALKQKEPNVVIVDYKMPEMSGLDVLRAIKEMGVDVPVIVLTAYGDVDITIKLMQSGAFDYIEKPILPKKLIDSINKAIEIYKKTRIMMDKAKPKIREIVENNILVGRSKNVRQIIKEIGRVSLSKANILITGDIGTGKVLIATMIHYSGITREEPIKVFHCDSVPEESFSEALFGSHNRLPNSRNQQRFGLFEETFSGTLILNAFERIPVVLQAAVARILENKEFVNSDGSVRFDARVIGVTSLSVEELIQSDQILNDLVFSLNVIHFQIPPLRDRKEDIPELMNFFLDKINRKHGTSVYRYDPEVIALLQNHSWPGNLKEFENTLTKAVLLAHSNFIETSLLGLESNIPGTDDSLTQIEPLSIIERDYIQKVLKKFGGNKLHTAKALGISRPTLDARLKTGNAPPTRKCQKEM